MYLRHPVRRDKKEFLEVRDRSRTFLAPWEPTPIGAEDPFTPGAFDRFHASARTETSRRFLICAIDDGRIVGQVGLGGIIRGAFQSCYIGYWIAANEVRKGYGGEAVKLAVSYAFSTLGLHRVEANIIPANEASKSLIRRLGFRHEGTAKSYLRIAGRWQDHDHWAVTKEEWGAAA